MARHDLDTVRTIYERWASGDPALDAFHPDAEFVVPHPDVLTTHGPDGVREFVRRWIGTWQEHRIELDELRPLEDGRVLAFFSEYGRAKASDVPLELHPAGIWTIRDGRAARFEAILNRADALAALGLEE